MTNDTEPTFGDDANFFSSSISSSSDKIKKKSINDDELYDASARGELVRPTTTTTSKLERCLLFSISSSNRSSEKTMDGKRENTQLVDCVDGSDDLSSSSFPTLRRSEHKHQVGCSKVYN